ncbi:MAG: PadR family transcriptional regulator [Nocardioides sp.]
MTSPSATPTTYGLLGMLAVRSWTGYELTQQVRRSLRFVWPTSEGHLYREQRRLVELGWARVEEEPAGARTRKRYFVTPAGRTALATWLATEPEEPHFQIEGVLRAFYADQGSADDLGRSLRTTAAMADDMLAELVGYAAEYLEEGGPLWLLEQGRGTEDDRQPFHGRPMFPERLHSVALAIEVTTSLLGTLHDFFQRGAEEVDAWPSTTDPALTESTRARLQRVVDRHPRRPAGDPAVDPASADEGAGE